jgi:hypothetical protein
MKGKVQSISQGNAYNELGLIAYFREAGVQGFLANVALGRVKSVPDGGETVI